MANPTQPSKSDGSTFARGAARLPKRLEARLYDKATIEAVLGAQAATYAGNKNRGGRNNAKGATYESYFAAARLASLMAKALAAGDNGADTWVQEQQLCFVDDLIVDQPGERRFSQLKSGAATSWTGGDHPIGDDFRMQRSLDQVLAINGAYELVVPTAEQRVALAADKPDDVVAEVIHFPAERDLGALIEGDAELASALDAIAIWDSRASVRRKAFETLLAAWVTSPEKISLAEFALHAAAGPGPVTTILGPDYMLPDPVAEHLRSLPGLDFEIRKKHLYYRFGAFTGYSAFRTGTPAFTRFEEFVVNIRPGPFEVIAALQERA